MRFDRHGFPIPAEFEPPSRPGQGRDDFDLVGVPPKVSDLAVGRPGPTRPAAWKRWLLLAVILGGVVPAIVVPEVLPVIREAVVMWSLKRATECEARSDLPGAITDVSRALRWQGDDADLLCMRAMLRLEDRDAPGALEDASRAAAIAPTAVQPWRVRALVSVVLDNTIAALEAADMVVELSTAGDPDALNHRAYIRGLLGRDLPAALVDIEKAVGATDDAAPEMLDTRGFLLHLLGRHQEAVDQMNLAIAGVQQNRRKLGLLAGRVDHAQLACRLRGLDHGLAVMLHHRALACRAVGLEEQAKQDSELARQKGFDPARGIF
ncbi:MAG: tetratricopeptide repeat protein [Planctomycetota bacterium]